MHMLQRRFPEPETMSGGNTRVSASSMSPNWYTVERVSWRRRLQRGVKRADRQDMSGGGVGVSFLGAVQRVSSCDKRPQLTPPAHIQTGNIHKYTCCPPPSTPPYLRNTRWVKWVTAVKLCLHSHSIKSDPDFSGPGLCLSSEHCLLRHLYSLEQ